MGLTAAGVKCHTKERETETQWAKAGILTETRQHWISLEMIQGEGAHLLEMVEGPYHPRIKHSREEYFTKKRRRAEEFAA